MKNYIQNPNQKVVITFDKNQTLARIYENNKEVARGVSHCAPEDKFDVTLSACVALYRAISAVEPVTKNQEWVVVNRKPKVGDYIRLKTEWFSFNEVGDILRVSEIIPYDVVGVKAIDHPHKNDKVDILEIWHYSSESYDVVEPVEKGIEIINGERYRKVSREPKPGDYMRVITSVYETEKRGDIYKISELRFKTIGVKHCDHPGMLKLFGDDTIPFINNDYIWWHNTDLNKLEILEKL